MKKLLNPRGYLSWSQIDLWRRNPERYIDQYIYGEGERKNDRMDFGSKVATAMETGEKSDNATINLLTTVMERYKSPEFELRASFNSQDGVFDLLGKLDSFDEQSLSFREYKTGTTAWTQKRVDNHRQLDHYSSLIWLKYKKLPKHIYLDWAKTEIVDGEVDLTGEIETFERKIDLGDILEYLAEASKVAREIDKVYRKEINKLK